MGAGDARAAAQIVRRQEKLLALTKHKPKKWAFLGQNYLTGPFPGEMGQIFQI